MQNGIQFLGDYYVDFSEYYTTQNIGPIAITNNTIQADLDGMNTTTPSGTIGIGIYASNLVDYLNSNGAYTNLLIQNNHLYNVQTGVIADNWRQMDGSGANPLIDNNYISMIPEPFGNPQYGILSTINTDAKISNNNIIETGGSFTDPSIGISCQDNNYGTHIECNSVSNTAIGIEFINNPATNPTSFKNNIMDGAGKGFVMDNSRIGTQGSSTHASDNQWTGNYGGTGQYTIYTTDFSSPTLSPLFVRSGSPWNPADPSVGVCSTDDSPTPLYTYTPSYGLTTGCSYVNSNCGTLPNHSPINLNNGINNGQQKSSQFINGVDIHLLEQMVTDSIVYDYFETEQHISDKFKVYRMLTMNPTLKDSSLILQHFYTTAAVSNIGNLANTENSLAKGQMAVATSFLNAVTPVNAVETNYKNYYEAYINYKDSTYSANDSAILKTLALGCPIRDGLVVYQARSLYSLIYNDFTLYRNDCGNTESRKLTTAAKVIKKENSLSIYPNPTANQFIISFNTKDKIDKIEVTIKNITGKIVDHSVLSCSNINQALYDKNLDEGVYFVTAKIIVTNNIHTSKLIIIK